MGKEAVIEKYLKCVEKEICNMAPSADFIESLRNDLYDYMEACSECTFEDLEKEFGTPEEIARDFISENSAIVPRKIRRSKLIRNIVIAVLAVVAITAVALIIDMASHTQVKASL